MLIDTKDLQKVLYSLKEDALSLVTRVPSSKVKVLIDNRVQIIDKLLIWINESEKTGELNMEALKLGQLVKWEPKPRAGSVDDAIIADAKNLKKNYDTIKVTVTEIPWTTFSNRTYKLRSEKKISDNIVPRKDENGTPYLVYLDEPYPRRSKR